MSWYTETEFCHSSLLEIMLQLLRTSLSSTTGEKDLHFCHQTVKSNGENNPPLKQWLTLEFIHKMLRYENILHSLLLMVIDFLSCYKWCSNWDRNLWWRRVLHSSKLYPQETYNHNESSRTEIIFPQWFNHIYLGFLKLQPHYTPWSYIVSADEQLLCCSPNQ